MTRHYNRTVAGLLTVFLVLSGCHRYVPVHPAQLTPDARIRVTAARGDAMTVQHDGDTVRGPWRRIDGRLLAMGADTITLRSATLQAHHGHWNAPNHVRVELRDDRGLQRRQLDGQRTAALILVPLLAIAVVLHGASTMAYR